MIRFLVAVDPGAVHCGVALFDYSLYAKGAPPLLEADEYEPRSLYHQLRRMAHTLRCVVVEEFRLYPWAMANLQMTTIETVEVIGVLKFICDDMGVPCVMQPATIKSPMRAQADARGLRLITSKGGHALDAQLHGYYHLLRSKVE